MKIKSFVLVLGLVFVNTLVYAGGRNALPAFKATLTRKVLLAKHVSPRTPRSLTIPPGNIKTVSPYKIPRQRFTVLGHISDGIFIMDSSTDLPKVIPARYRSKEGKYSVTPRMDEHEKELLESEFEAFRGIHLMDLADLKNLLKNGSQVDKTHYSRIHFTTSLETALWYATPQYRYETIPVLITFKSYCYDSFGVSYEDIPAKDQEVFAYLHHNGKDAWYHVSLINGNIITEPLEFYFAKQKTAEQDTNNHASSNGS